MSRRKPKQPKSTAQRQRCIDVDGATMAIDRLADLNADAFDDVLEVLRVSDPKRFGKAMRLLARLVVESRGWQVLDGGAR